MKMKFIGLAALLVTGLGACSADYEPIAKVTVGGHVTDQIGVVRTGNGPNDGTSGQQLVAVDSKTGLFREIGQTVGGPTLTAAVLPSTIGAYGAYRAAGNMPSDNINVNAAGGNAAGGTGGAGGAGGGAFSASYAEGGKQYQINSQVQLTEVDVRSILNNTTVANALATSNNVTFESNKYGPINIGCRGNCN